LYKVLGGIERNMKVKIEKISISEGTSKTSGKPYKRAILEFNGQQASMFINEKFGTRDLEVLSTWKIGDEVEVMIEQSGQYLNFKLPSKTDLLAEKVLALEGRVERLEEVIKNAQDKKAEKTAKTEKGKN
jgi:hypothetical protein